MQNIHEQLVATTTTTTANRQFSRINSSRTT